MTGDRLNPDSIVIFVTYLKTILPRSYMEKTQSNKN